MTIQHDAPEFARRVRDRFEAGTNKTIATLRKDGSPRISGIEMQITDDDATLGMSGGSRKLLDVRRDPRVAIHAPTIEPPKPTGADWAGDAKLTGRLVQIGRPPDSAHPGAGYFSVDIDEVVLTYVSESGDHLVIESWHAGVGWRQRKRYD